MTDSIERNFLPNDLQFAHEYCLFLHDILVRLVVEGETKQIFRHRFNLASEADGEQIAQNSGDELVEWMKENGYDAVWREVARKHICVALLSDFCHFVYEALQCSRKGKLTVTFALLRKPLKENLFYFEWMLADPTDFADRFHIAPADGKSSLPLPTDLSKERRLEIVSGAMAKTKTGGYASPEFIYELRYDKKCAYGFEELFQKATHLITTFTVYTEAENLNFIFSGDNERMTQWQGLYALLPIILMHAVSVITTLIREFDDGKLEDLDFLLLRATVGFLLFAESGPWNEQKFDASIELSALLGSGIPCLGCHTYLKFDRDNLQNIHTDGLLECHECGYKTVLTTNHQLLLSGHLAQGRIRCPNCNAAVSASKENFRLLVDSQKVVCQECAEEIEIHLLHEEE